MIAMGQGWGRTKPGARSFTQVGDRGYHVRPSQEQEAGLEVECLGHVLEMGY